LPLLKFQPSYNVNTSFLHNSTARQFKTLTDRKETDNILEFREENFIGFTCFSSCSKI